MNTLTNIPTILLNEAPRYVAVTVFWDAIVAALFVAGLVACLRWTRTAQNEDALIAWAGVVVAALLLLVVITDALNAVTAPTTCYVHHLLSK